VLTTVTNAVARAAVSVARELSCMGVPNNVPVVAAECSRAAAEAEVLSGQETMATLLANGMAGFVGNWLMDGREARTPASTLPQRSRLIRVPTGKLPDRVRASALPTLQRRCPDGCAMGPRLSNRVAKRQEWARLDEYAYDVDLDEVRTRMRQAGEATEVYGHTRCGPIGSS
jgi:hypothetical protein